MPFVNVEAGRSLSTDNEVTGGCEQVNREIHNQLADQAPAPVKSHSPHLLDTSAQTAILIIHHHLCH